MRKNSTILLNNISKNEFKTCFKYKVHDLKELRTSGFSGEIVNDFFWIQYYPEHLSPQNILEWKMPTILEGRIYSKGDKVIISLTLLLFQNGSLKFESLKKIIKNLNQQYYSGQIKKNVKQ